MFEIGAHDINVILEELMSLLVDSSNAFTNITQLAKDNSNRKRPSMVKHILVFTFILMDRKYVQ